MTQCIVKQEDGFSKETREPVRCLSAGLKRLNVHHVQPWSKAAHMRFETFNLITLCRNCHDSIKDQEHHYISLFMGIIKKNENNTRH